MRHLHQALALAGALALGGCMSVSPHGTTIASDPPGARVDVDGRDSGWVTPCMLDLGDDETRHVTISLPGYVAQEVVFRPDTQRSVVSWSQGVAGKSTLHCPLFLPPHDLLLPLRVEHSLAPGRVFVQLRLEGAP